MGQYDKCLNSSTSRSRCRKTRPGRTSEDFEEIYNNTTQTPLSSRPAAAPSAECLLPDQLPPHNNIPDWLMLTAEGRLEEAFEVSSATNNLPEICGRICPQDRLCEGNCVIEQSGHGTVTIGSVEKYITDTAFERGWVKPVSPQRELDQSVGIIGGGPAGMAAAEQLRRRGYKVHVYDRNDRIGGLLIYGIPNFKLEKDVVQRRVDLLEQEGRVHRNFEVGRDATLREIREHHDAVLIATGVWARDVQVPGVGQAAPGAEFLVASNRQVSAIHSLEDGSWMRRTRISSSSAAATPRWTACALPSARVPARSHASTAETARICRVPVAKFITQKEEGVNHMARAEAFVGEDNVTACVRNAFIGRGHIRPSDTGTDSGVESARKRISPSKRWASIRKICRPYSMRRSSR